MGMDSGILKGFIKFGTLILQIIIGLGGLKTVAIVAGLALLTLNSKAVLTFFSSFPKFIMNVITDLRLLTMGVYTAQTALGAFTLILGGIALVWGIVSAANDRANQKMKESSDAFAEQTQTLSDLKKRTDEIMAGVSEESDKRVALIEVIKGMNSEYEEEANQLKTTTELRDLAIKKMKEEGAVAAKEFQRINSKKISEAKNLLGGNSYKSVWVDPEERLSTYQTQMDAYDKKKRLGKTLLIQLKENNKN
jgi:hypothetical protein